MRFRAPCALVVLVTVVTSGARAQVFRLQGGDSTLLNAEGGSVEFKAPNYDGSIGLGLYNGKFELGGETRKLYHGYTLLAGDEAVQFTLPTDIFDPSHYFSARGMGVTGTDKTAQRSFYAFAGTTSTWLGTGFFNAARSESPAGIFFYQQELRKNLKCFSSNIVSNRQTSLEGIEWSPEKWAKASLAGGIGSNQPYFAAAFDAETRKLAFKSSYVVTGDAFRRVTVIGPMASEVNKGNIQMLYKPNEFFSITTGHQNILEPLTENGPMQQASINQVSTDMHVDRFYFGTGLFTSNAYGRSTRGTNFYLGRRIGQRLEVNTNYFDSQSQNGGSTTILSGTVRENFSSRFSLLQLVSRTGGQNTFALGGDFTSNRLILRADYQNVYLPFRPDRPFEQALALNVTLRITGPLELTAASNVAPDGRLRYSFGASTYLYRVSGMLLGANSSDSFSIAKYVVQGGVNDDQGDPVEGAALHIGKEVAYTDSSGNFQVRFSKRGPYPLSVVPEEFINNGVFEIVSAPRETRAELENLAPNLKIVVRQVPRSTVKVNQQ